MTSKESIIKEQIKDLFVLYEKILAKCKDKKNGRSVCEEYAKEGMLVLADIKKLQRMLDDEEVNEKNRAKKYIISDMMVDGSGYISYKANGKPRRGKPEREYLFYYQVLAGCRGGLMVFNDDVAFKSHFRDTKVMNWLRGHCTCDEKGVWDYELAHAFYQLYINGSIHIK